MIGYFIFNAVFDYLHKDQSGGGKAYVQLHGSNIGSLIANAVREAVSDSLDIPSKTVQDRSREA